MNTIIFITIQINQLEENPNVASVSERSIQYTVDSKVKAVRKNMEGKGPRQIFMVAEVDLTVIGEQKAQSSLNLWRQTFRKDGEERLRRRTPEDRQVDGKTVGEGRGTDQTPDSRGRTLKKSREVRRVGKTYEQISAEKYQTLNTVIRIAQLKNLVHPLCEIAEVSRSGY